MSILHSRFRPTRRRDRAGAAMILMLIFLVAVIGMVAFSVDIGLSVLLRAEVQNAVDSGALAACLKLKQDPDKISEAEDAARQFVQLNRAGMTTLSSADRLPGGDLLRVNSEG